MVLLGQKHGDLYYKGLGAYLDYKKAFELYQKSATQGNLKAQNGLANCYRYGNGIIKDYEEAHMWYKKAAEQGDAESQFLCGKYSHYKKNYSEAKEWYMKAAKQGYQPAIDILN